MANPISWISNGWQGFLQSRFVTVFKIKELRQKILLTLLLLAIYRIGFHIPLPMINQEELARRMGGAEEGILGVISMFSG